MFSLNFNSSCFKPQLSWALLCCLFMASQANAKNNVPNVRNQQLNAEFWQAKPASDNEVRMTESEITAFNQHLFATNKYMVRPLDMAKSLNKKALLNKISSISSVPKSARFYPDGQALSPQDFAAYMANTNQQGVQDSNKVQFGLVVKRAAMRTFPTLDRVLNKGMDADLDRFQETAVFPGEAVAILHTSADGQWYLAQNYHYLAWVKQDAVALGQADQIQDYLESSDFLLVTGAKVFTTYVPNQAQVSEVQLDMGVKLPLVAPAQQGFEIYDQSTASNYQVRLPIRHDDGSLGFQTALIGRTQDVRQGYLPFTTDNIVAQGFKFLGERYGWGHDYNGRDCTGFVGEIYKTFGLLMPRNSGQQGKGTYGTNFRFAANTDNQAKLEVIKQLEIGDLIYIPGHVMIYLGEENNQPYVIHDVKGLAYWTPQGEFYNGTLNAVSVTPLLPLQLNKKTSYLDRIYNIKRLTPINHTENQ
ncbi:C40 family peptidase [Paraglaciecola aestuariivivens]